MILLCIEGVGDVFVSGQDDGDTKVRVRVRVRFKVGFRVGVRVSIYQCRPPDFRHLLAVQVTTAERSLTLVQPITSSKQALLSNPLSDMYNHTSVFSVYTGHSHFH